MVLGLNREHLDLAEAVRGWANRYCPAEVVRAAVEGPDGGPGRYTNTLRPRLAEQGLLGLHVPEEHGGQGYGITEAAVALEELGRALVPGGFLPTVLASAALLAGGGPPKLIAGLADGSITGAVSLAQVGALVGAVNDTASNKIVNKRIMNWRACPCRRPVNEAAA